MKKKETCCLCNREVSAILGGRWCTMEVGVVCEICDAKDPANPKNWPTLKGAPAHVIAAECKRWGYRWY